MKEVGAFEATTGKRSRSCATRGVDDLIVEDLDPSSD
jgi:hypothetical protein